MPSLANKADVVRWRESEHTKHVFYSPYEGVMKNVRVSEKEGGNSPMVLHGFVADYDQVLGSDQSMIDTINANQSPDYPVTYAARTFSGGAHLVWEFEKPINIINPRMLKGFLDTFVTRSRAKRVLGGFDKMSLRPHLYYTMYPNWHMLSMTPVQDNLLQHLLFNVGTSLKPYEAEGPALPWGVIEQELHRRFPGRWTGKVEEGARGVRVWDPTSTNATGAMLTNTGIVYFTDGGGFMPWGSPTLFGGSFVSQYQADRVGGAVKDIYYDGKSFYRKVNGDWRSDNMEITKNHLVVAGGLESKVQKGKGCSEINEAIEHISNNNRVAGQLPFVYRKDSLVTQKGKVFINSSTMRCHPMSDSAVKWGEGFPFIADWIDNFFYSNFQKALWLSWLHHFYKNSYDGTPRAGQCMFIAGGSSKGKTLMNHRLLSWMMGGHSDIANYVTGEDNFNDNLFEVGLGTVDDQLAASDRRAHLRYTALLKKLVANNVLSMRAMYNSAVDIDWCGRLSVTMNEDPESMRMLPDLDINNRDKVLILRCSKKAIQFPQDVEDVIRQELSCFCRYIYDFTMPKECVGTARFGVKSYIDPTLAEESDYSSSTYAAVEIINEWRESYFTTNPGDTEWFGSITRLTSELAAEFGENSQNIKTITPASLSRYLTIAMNRHSWIKRDTRNGVKGFIIERDSSMGIQVVKYEDEPQIDPTAEFDPLTLTV